MFTEWPEVCPFVPPAPWVSSRPSQSALGTPGGQSLKWKLQSTLAPPVSYAGVFCMLVNMFFPIYMAVKCNNKTTTKKSGLGHCSASQCSDKITGSLYAAMTSFFDILCLGFMTLATSSMVFLPHRYKQTVQCIHRNTLSPRPICETMKPEPPKAPLFWWPPLYHFMPFCPSFKFTWISLIILVGSWWMSLD